MEVKTYEQLLAYLEKDAVNHIAYYHYTRWESLRKMLSDVDCGDGVKHKFLLLTRAAKTNDGIEERWSQNYYMACFSLSRYEDVAMWLNYGKRRADAVRIKITRDAMDDWLAIKRHDVYMASNSEREFVFDRNVSSHEDTKVTEAEILAAGGEAVLAGIKTLSFRCADGLPDAEYDRLKAEYVAGVANAPAEILVVKMADRICNTLDFLKAGDMDHARTYLAKGEVLFAHIGEMKHGDSIQRQIDAVRGKL